MGSSSNLYGGMISEDGTWFGHYHHMDVIIYAVILAYVKIMFCLLVIAYKDSNPKYKSFGIWGFSDLHSRVC